ncbi:ABC transporter permease subunit [Clostridium sp.]|uniref:ABC transporter permease subunit n=1 Tax=Clostridium sp. TaxID=1506 RepID=UPI003F33687B
MKIFRLTYNELVKQFKKPSIKIIFALILISAIVLPMAVNKIPVDRYSANALESYKFMLEQENENVEFFKEDKTQKGQIAYQYAVINRDAAQMFVDYKIGFDDWKSGVVDYYKDASYNLAAIEFVLEGYDQNVIMEGLRGTDSKTVASYYDDKMTLAKKKEIEASYIAEKEKLKSILEQSNYQGYTEERIVKTRGYIADRQNEIAEYEKLKEKNPQTKEGIAELQNLEKNANHAREIIPFYEQDIQVMEFRLNNNIDYDLNNWKNNSIKTIEKELQDLRIKLMTEKEYSSQAALQGISMTYDEYVENYKSKSEKRIEKIKQLWYGLENNIPALDDIRDARSVLNSTYEIYIILAVIMVIIIGGGIVATEFSKGTIRLLLIRPVSRWKVLLSKLLAVLVVGFAIVILGIGILYASTGYVFGFETYKTPILETINGAIMHIEFINFLLPKVVISCASLVFISSLVFMISTLARNTALAVAISMILYLGTAPATDLLISAKQIWIINTLIPYINSSYLRLVPTTERALAEGFGLQLQYQNGAIQLLIVSAIMLILTFIIFVKKDVKN